MSPETAAGAPPPADTAAAGAASPPAAASGPGTAPATAAWELDQLPALALRVREHIVRMATAGGCFIGASLSCADLLVHLYTRVLRLSPATLDDPGRDYLFLSKGHDVPALYGTLAELGYIPRERLANHLKTTDSIYWHPNRAVPGVEFHSGSLGHLLSVGIGVALDIRLRGGANRVFVILGDGELDEGSVWEACLVANALGLDNLTAIVDRNEFQANIRTEELMPLEPIAGQVRGLRLELPHRRRPQLRGARGGARAAAGGALRAGRPTRGRRADGARQGAALDRSSRRPLVRQLHRRGDRGAARRAARRRVAAS